jgi:type I restriction enzyme S subunit
MGREWTATSLAEISTNISYGYTESATDEPVGPRFLRITDIQGGIVVWDAVPFCPISKSDYEKYRLRQGDIVIARTGNSTGENYLFNSSEDAVYASYLIRFQIDSAKADPRYVWYNLRTSKWWSFVNGSKTGSAQAGANAKVLGRYSLELPPLPEQKAIAHILGSLDDKIELNRKMNETLEAMARTIFKSWFVDFDPVRAKAEGRKPEGMDAETAKLFPDSFEDSELGEIPKGWRVSILGECLSVHETGCRPRGGVGGIDHGIPSIGAESIVGLGLFDFSKTRFVPVDFYNSMRRGKIEDRDVLLYKDGGRPGQFEPHVSMFGDGFPYERCCINEHVYRLRGTPPISQEWLYFWLRTPLLMDEMRNRGTGVAIPGLNSEAVRALPIVQPSPETIGAATGVIAPLIEAILANCNESKTLTGLRNALLPKLLSGEIRIKEAERFIENVA